MRHIAFTGENPVCLPDRQPDRHERRLHRLADLPYPRRVPGHPRDRRRRLSLERRQGRHRENSQQRERSGLAHFADRGLTYRRVQPPRLSGLRSDPKIVATRGFYQDRALESRFITEETGGGLYARTSRSTSRTGTGKRRSICATSSYCTGFRILQVSAWPRPSSTRPSNRGSIAQSDLRAAP
jgi:hypothetical protein